VAHVDNLDRYSRVVFFPIVSRVDNLGKDIVVLFLILYNGRHDRIDE
jgi:hypothetical protein